MRELRQNASRYLQRVEEEGSSYQVTDRGRPVALLVPVPGDLVTQLIAAGVVTPPSHPENLAALEPADYGFDASAELAALRADEH